MPISPRLLFTIAGVLFALIVLWPGSKADAVTQARLLVGQDRVVLLTAEWCGYCDRLRSDLKRAQVPFAEHDVERSSSGSGAWQALQGRGVPMTLVGNAVVSGYDPKRIIELAGDSD
jgi:glutaredoxin